MGCMESKEHVEQDYRPSPAEYESNIETLEQFNVTASNLVQEKHGEISTDYLLQSPPLGEGAFGSVMKCVHKQTGEVRAVKIINKELISLDELDRLRLEVDILKRLDHPNILKVYEFYQGKKYFYIVTELCTGGELFDKIVNEGFFNEKQAADTMREVFQAVNYCHSNNVVHRDLKPENILYESKNPDSLLKIVDFGTSITFDPTVKLNQRLGTAMYIAPEVLTSPYNEKCDIWSCGVILYILLSGIPPFGGDSDEEVLEKVKRAKYSLDGPEWRYISNNAKDLLYKLLEKDPKKRLSAVEALNHPWIAQSSKIQSVDNPVLQNALSNLQNYRAGKKLQQATWMFLVNYLSSKEEKAELLKVFQALDSNNDGKLSRDELIQGYRKIFNIPHPEKEVDRILAAVDKNNSGEVDYSEWVAATINRENMLSKQRLELAFKMFDKDGSGTVSKDEIKQMFAGMGNVQDDVWNQVILEVDENGDGELSYQEFKDMMLKLIDNPVKGHS